MAVELGVSIAIVPGKLCAAAVATRPRNSRPVQWSCVVEDCAAPNGIQPKTDCVTANLRVPSKRQAKPETVLTRLERREAVLGQNVPPQSHVTEMKWPSGSAAGLFSLLCATAPGPAGSLHYNLPKDGLLAGGTGRLVRAGRRAFLWKTKLRPKSGRARLLNWKMARRASSAPPHRYRSKDVTQEQTELTSLAQSLVQSRISTDAPQQTLIRTIVRACDDARGLLRSRRTDALVAELELLRRYSVSRRRRTPA